MCSRRIIIRKILDQPKLPKTDVPDYVMDRLRGKISENSVLKFLYQFKKHHIRKRYAYFGRNSGLKPGVCWPTKEELDFMKQYETKFEKSISFMQEKLANDKKAEEETRAKREMEIIANLKKLPKLKEEFWKSYHKLYEDIELEKTNKEKLIQEVREYLGYDIEPNDPRFEEALAKKDEEAKAELRAARKLEKQRQHMEMLQALVSDALEKEKSESKMPEPSKTEDNK